MLVSALLSSSATPLGDSPALELKYSGTLSKMGRSGPEQPVKKFTLLAIAAKSETGLRLNFLTDERGGGSWAWPERFGVLELNGKNEAANNGTIRLLAEHEGVLNPLTLRQPLFEHADKLELLAKDADEAEDEWSAGQSTFTVRDGKRGDRECWLVQVATNNGRRQRLWVSKENNTTLLAAEQQVFMGRGEEYQLKFDLESAKPLDAAMLAKLQKPLTPLLDLKTQLNRAETETKAELTAEQIASARKVIGTIEADSDGTPFAPLAAVISRDVKTQSQRSEDVAGLGKKYIGKPAPDWQLTTLDKKTISAKDLAGKIVVLHFWDYEGEPLTEPYGQVGYLDFLANKRKKFGIEVIGVAVNESFADAAKVTGALRSVRKLREFMNLSYPIATDDSTLLAKFGDPRKLGAKLPLWIVINPDGQIAHYQVGFYNIKADEGLRPLDEAVMKQIKTK